jgi:5'-nucleotidase
MPGYFGAPVVATITEDLTATVNSNGESQLGDLTADAQRAIASADASIVAEAALCPGAPDQPASELAFLATPNRAADADGRVLWSEALATQYCYSGVDSNLANFTNKNVGSFIIKASLTGQQLYDALTVGLGGPAAAGTVRTPFYVSGITYTWQDAVAPDSPKVVEIRKNGAPIDLNASFTVALSDFLSSAELKTGALYGIVGANVSVIPNVGPIAVFGEYLSQLPQPISAPPLDRVTRLAPTSD